MGASANARPPATVIARASAVKGPLRPRKRGWVQAIGGIAYLMDTQSADFLELVDGRTPTRPESLGHVDLLQNACDSPIPDTHADVAAFRTWWDVVWAVDVSEPSSPCGLGRTDVHHISAPVVWDPDHVLLRTDRSALLIFSIARR